MNIIKFNGKLEITSKWPAELDKEKFTEAVKKNIYLFDLHTWYYIPGPDRTIRDLCQDYHAFTLQEVIENYYLRAEEPLVENGYSGDENDVSKDSRFRSYDKYEFYARGFYRLTVESCVSMSL